MALLAVATSGTGDKRSLLGAVSAVVVSPTAAPPACASSWGYCGSNHDGVKCCPSGEYCQPWNPTYHQCRPAPQQCEAQQVGVDFYGDDISTIYGILPAECCAKYTDTAGCKAHTLVNFNSNRRAACYLKRGTGNMRALVGAVSAEVANPKPEPTCATPPYGSCGDSRGAKCCSPDAYCQPWNHDFYQCMHLPVQYLQQFTDVDFYGNDIATFYGLQPKACCAKCVKTAGCKRYTHVNGNPGSPACYLKSGLAGKRAKSGAVSGVLN